MHRVCATYVNFVLFFIDRVSVNATIVNEAAHAVISDEAECPVVTRADRCLIAVPLYLVARGPLPLTHQRNRTRIVQCGEVGEAFQNFGKRHFKKASCVIIAL